MALTTFCIDVRSLLSGCLSVIDIFHLVINRIFTSTQLRIGGSYHNELQYDHLSVGYHSLLQPQTPNQTILVCTSSVSFPPLEVHISATLWAFHV